MSPLVLAVQRCTHSFGCQQEVVQCNQVTSHGLIVARERLSLIGHESFLFSRRQPAVIR
jgi:hypothetical protein